MMVSENEGRAAPLVVLIQGPGVRRQTLSSAVCSYHMDHGPTASGMTRSLIQRFAHASTVQILAVCSNCVAVFDLPSLKPERPARTCCFASSPASFPEHEHVAVVIR